MPKGKDTRHHPNRGVSRFSFDIANMAAMTSPNYGKDDIDAYEAMEDARGNDGLKSDSGFSEREMRD